MYKLIANKSLLELLIITFSNQVAVICVIFLAIFNQSTEENLEVKLDKTLSISSKEFQSNSNATNKCEEYNDDTQ